MNRKFEFGRGAVLVALTFAVSFVAGGAQNGAHKIKVTFNYDFGSTPACSAKVAQRCVKDFVLYDISAGIQKRTQLTTIPLPANPKGLVKGITATTPSLPFESGKHFIGVVARAPSGAESKLCTAWVTVP
jgi:hypothetical protein